MIQVITERFIHTNILAQQKVRRKEVKGRISFLIPAFLGVFILICFLFLLWIRISILQIGYQISQAHEVKGQLMHENKTLRVERAALMSSSRIEQIARNKLGMVTPKSKQIIVLEW